MTEEARKFHEESKRASESWDKGIEHAAHHALRGMGMNGIMLGAGAGAFMATAGFQLSEKIVENYREHIEEMRKIYDDAVKTTMKVTEGSGASAGISFTTANKIAEASDGAVTADEAAKMGAAIRKRDPGATPKQIADAIITIKNNAPTAGGEALAGEMAKFGIPNEVFGKLNDLSENNSDAVADLLEKNKRRILGQHWNPTGVAAIAAKDLASMTPEYAQRDLNRHSAADFEDAAKSLDLRKNVSTPEVDMLRSQNELDTRKRQLELEEARDSDAAQKTILLNQLQKLFPDAWKPRHDIMWGSGPQNADEFMNKNKLDSYDKFYENAIGYTAWNMEGRGFIHAMQPWRNEEEIVKALEANTAASHGVKNATDKTTNSYLNDSSHH